MASHLISSVGVTVCAGVHISDTGRDSCWHSHRREPWQDRHTETYRQTESTMNRSLHSISTNQSELMQNEPEPAGQPWTDDKYLLEREAYIQSHPEIVTIMTLLKIEIVRAKPDNICEFAASFFSQKNRPKLESALSMKLSK